MRLIQPLEIDLELLGKRLSELETKTLGKDKAGAKDTCEKYYPTTGQSGNNDMDKENEPFEIAKIAQIRPLLHRLKLTEEIDPYVRKLENSLDEFLAATSRANEKIGCCQDTDSETIAIHIASNNASNATAHNASCNACLNLIKGLRYKCFQCPDFDLCSSCHEKKQPGFHDHDFAKLIEPLESLTREKPRVIHRGVYCDGPRCRSRYMAIDGVRYKCLVCPHSYDLCANCEALPSNNHPRDHPMVKIYEPFPDLNVVHIEPSSQVSKGTQSSADISKQQSVTDSLVLPIPPTDRKPIWKPDSTDSDMESDSGFSVISDNEIPK